MLTVKLSKTNQNKNLTGRCPYGSGPHPYVWEERPKGILVRVIQRNVAYSLDTSPSMAFFLISSPIFLSSLSFFFFCSFSFAVFALYSSMPLLYVAISCSSWFSLLYYSSGPDLLVIQRINITILSIATVLGLGMNKFRGIWHVGTVLAYVC